MNETTDLVERLRELPRDTRKATMEIYDLCVEASYKIEELVDRCARYAEEIAVLQEEQKRMAAADVAPVVHGRWVPFHSEAAGNIQYCSACEIGFAAKTDYCPHCGTRMDGGGDNG